MANQSRGPFRAHRGLVVLLALLVLLGSAYVVVDLVTRAEAETQLQQTIASRTSADSVRVSLDTWPFLFDLLAEAKVSHVDVTLREVPLPGLEIHRIYVVAEDVHVDRGLLFRQHRLRVESVRSATAKVMVTASELSRASGHLVVLRGHSAEVETGLVTIGATLRIRRDTLDVVVAGRQLLAIDLARSPLVPRCQLRLRIEPGAVLLSCHLSPVPHSLLAAISS